MAALIGASSRWRCALVGALALLAIGCGPAGKDESASAGASSEPVPAPPFTLAALRGGEISLADFRGRPVVIDFWATWCAPCVHQIPILNAFQARFGDDVPVLGLSVDARGAEVVEPFTAEHPIDYRVLFADETLAQAYGAMGFPTLFVVSPEGEIDSMHVGVISEAELDEAVSEWVSPRSAQGS